MPSTVGSPTTWTLRFKNHRSTTLLHADPLQSFNSLKEDLLQALRQTHPNGRINGVEIPSDPASVLLARPNDIHNLEKGFTSVTDKEGNIITGNEQVGKKRKSGDPELKIKEPCPKAAGLKDGAVLAYKFRIPKTAKNYDPAIDEDWDVVIPSYDDQEAS